MNTQLSEQPKRLTRGRHGYRVDVRCVWCAAVWKDLVPSQAERVYEVHAEVCGRKS